MPVQFGVIKCFLDRFGIIKCSLHRVEVPSLRGRPGGSIGLVRENAVGSVR